MRQSNSTQSNFDYCISTLEFAIYIHVLNTVNEAHAKLTAKYKVPRDYHNTVLNKHVKAFFMA